MFEKEKCFFQFILELLVPRYRHRH